MHGLQQGRKPVLQRPVDPGSGEGVAVVDELGPQGAGDHVVTGAEVPEHGADADAGDGGHLLHGGTQALVTEDLHGRPLDAVTSELPLLLDERSAGPDLAIVDAHAVSIV